jgi:hypothetical protein
MNEGLIYSTIGILTFMIGLLLGHILTTAYYGRRFIAVAKECRDRNSIEPVID